MQCVVLTGLVKGEYIQPLMEMYKDVKYKILSTWKDQPHLHIFRNNGFIIQLNDYPCHSNQTNLQLVNIREGCILAKKLGFKYVVRMRTDLICNNMVKFLECIPKDDKLSIIGFIETHTFYIVDFLMASSVETMLKIFDKEQKPGDERFVEQYLMEEWLGYKLPAPRTGLQQGDSHFNVIYDTLKEASIDFVLLSKPWGFIIASYCQQYFFRK